MLAKNNSMQQSNRRTPLSLGSSMKPSKSNDNNKKETNSNQKTENQKKDSQMERKLSADQKKQSTTDSKRTSSTDSRKQDDNKLTKNEDNKKNQNGVNGSGSNGKQSNKQNSNEAVVKVKSEPAATSNGSSASNKKESQKQAEKKKEPAVVVDLIAKPEESIGDKTKESKEAKNEENKNKASDKKEEKQTMEVSNTQNLDQDKAKEKKASEPAAVEKKNTDEIATEVPSEEKSKANEHEVTMVVSDTVEEQATKTAEEPNVPKTPIKENRAEEAPKEDIAMLDNASEDIEMMESLKYIEDQPTTSNVFAVSTPAKNCSPKEALNLFDVPSQRSPKSEIKTPKETLAYTPDRKSCPRTFSSISGRRSIRPIGDYTFSGNLQIRESYRKINTELDFTTSSLNVTVGSEVPNNESFSFFSRSRKRDRSSPSHPSAMEVQSDISPKSPKRARVDNTGGGAMYGFFNAMASPITMLRNRLARASVQSTPKKLIVDQIEQEIVENVSAIAVEAIDEDLTATEEQMLNPDSTVADAEPENNEQPQPEKCSQQNPDLPGSAAEAIDDIKIKETITATDSQAKKRCSIM